MQTHVHVSLAVHMQQRCCQPGTLDAKGHQVVAASE